MAELTITEIVVLAVLVLIGIGILIVIGYFVFKFIQDMKKNPDYLEKTYKDFVDFLVNNCPDSIYKYQLKTRTNQYAEGRVLGQIFGYTTLNLNLVEEEDKKNKKKELVKEKQTAQDTIRHFICFLPVKFQKKWLDPSTWVPKYRIAIINPDEVPDGLNGNVYWTAMGVDSKEYYYYSVSDKDVSRAKLQKLITSDVGMKASIETLRSVGRWIDRAAEFDSDLKKSIKHMTEKDAK